jgi:predicted permease
MGIMPIFFLLLGWCLTGPVELKRVILLQAAMPAAVFPIVMAKHYGGDARTALRVVIATSLVGFATIPLWIRLGQKILFPDLPGDVE